MEVNSVSVPLSGLSFVNGADYEADYGFTHGFCPLNGVIFCKLDMVRM